MSGNSIVRTCLVLGAVAFVCAAYLCYDLVHSRAAAIEALKEEARAETVRAATQISEELGRLPAIVRSLADDFVAGRLTDDALNRRLESILVENPPAYAVGVAFAPAGSGSRRRLRAPSVTRKGESLEQTRLEEEYDYTGAEVRWYHEAIEGGAGWREPAWEPGETSLSAAGVPVSTGHVCRDVC